MIKRIGAPVRTRVPLSGWILALALTLLSLASSLSHLASDHAVASAKQTAHYAGLY
jgi:hypothetical protein